MNKENKHNKDLGFQVPQDFFNNFEEEMMTQLNLNEMLGKETGFKVPDGYFESLENQLMPSSSSEPVKVKKLIPTSSGVRLLYPLLAVAAVFAIILMLNKEVEPIDIASVETSELEDYLIEESFLYDDAAEILFADNDILDQINFSEGIESDDLYDYLEDEIELNEIIIE